MPSDWKPKLAEILVRLHKGKTGILPNYGKFPAFRRFSPPYADCGCASAPPLSRRLQDTPERRFRQERRTKSALPNGVRRGGAWRFWMRRGGILRFFGFAGIRAIRQRPALPPAAPLSSLARRKRWERRAVKGAFFAGAPLTIPSKAFRRGFDPRLKTTPGDGGLDGSYDTIIPDNRRTGIL